MKKLVVVGNGMAGARVVEEILKRAPDRFDIVMFGAEPYGNYNRILLSNVLNGTPVRPGHLHESAVVVSRQRHHAARRRQGHSHRPRTPRGRRHAAEERRPWRTPPTRPATRTRRSIEEPYDHVIIATGSRPFVPPMEGFGGPGTFLFRTIDDCSRIADYARASRRAAVIGGGLLGLEAARGLLTHGVEVTVLEAAPQLMMAQLDPGIRRHAPRDHRAAWASRCCSNAITTQDRPRPTAASRIWSSRTAPRWRPTWWSSAPASGRSPKSPRPPA